MLNYKLLVGKIAKAEFALHSFAIEWRTAIITVFILRYVTIAISVYASLEFFQNLLLPMINNIYAANILAVVFICLIEFLTMVFLSKCFKFTIRRMYMAAVVCFMAAVIVYLISFHSSTTGLAQRQGKQIDNTKNIVSNTELQKTNLTNELNNEIDRLQKAIETEKSNPQGWQKRKRTVLTSDQLKAIQTYNDQILIAKTNYNKAIETIDTAKDKSIKQNNATVQIESEKYYSFASLIMLFQFLTNGFLMFAWSRIYSEDNKEDLLSETVKIMKQNLSVELFNHAYKELNSISTMLLNGLTLQSNNMILSLPVNDTTTTTTTTTETPEPEPDKNKKLGFQIGKNLIHDNRGINDKAIHDNRGSGNRLCKHCNKNYIYKHHKQLYCSEECRIKAYELRTGKKLNFKG